jgi:hypothetical protein
MLYAQSDARSRHVNILTSYDIGCPMLCASALRHAAPRVCLCCATDVLTTHASSMSPAMRRCPGCVHKVLAVHSNTVTTMLLSSCLSMCCCRSVAHVCTVGYFRSHPEVRHCVPPFPIIRAGTHGDAATGHLSCVVLFERQASGLMQTHCLWCVYSRCRCFWQKHTLQRAAPQGTQLWTECVQFGDS